MLALRLIAAVVPLGCIAFGADLVRSSTSSLVPQPAVIMPRSDLLAGAVPETPTTVPARPAPVTMRSVDRKRKHPPTFRLVRLSSPALVARWPNGPAKGILGDHTGLGSPAWLWVVSRSSNGRWLRVVLPWMPNGTTGWIRRGHRRVLTTRVSLDADLSQRRLRLMRNGHPLVAFRSAIGSPVSPTPTGRFSVTDRVATGDPAGPFGWYAFGLSGHQPKLPPGWSGGDQLAIHGTDQPSSIGSAVSAGCLRISARALWILRRYVRLGTPVVIRQ